MTATVSENRTGWGNTAVFTSQACLSQKRQQSDKLVDSSTQLVGDTGCSFSLSSEALLRGFEILNRIRLEKEFSVAGGILKTEEAFLVRFQAQCVASGKWMKVQEWVAVHPDMDSFLFACASRVCFLGRRQGWLELKTEGGKKFKARVARQNGGPILLTKTKENTVERAMQVTGAIPGQKGQGAGHKRKEKIVRDLII